MIDVVECHLGGCPYYRPREVCTHPKAENSHVAQRMEGDVPRRCPIVNEPAVLVVADDREPFVDQARKARAMLKTWEKTLTGEE